MFKFHHTLLPNVFERFFVANNSVHDHDTRQKDQLHVPLAISDTIKVTGVRCFNFFQDKLNMELPSTDYDLRLFYDSYKYNLRKFIRENDTSNILSIDT